MLGMCGASATLVGFARASTGETSLSETSWVESLSCSRNAAPCSAAALPTAGTRAATSTAFPCTAAGLERRVEPGDSAREPNEATAEAPPKKPQA